MDYKLLYEKIDSALLKCVDSNKTYIKFYGKQIQLYESMLQNELKCKPPKFSKTAYSEWQKKVDSYIDKITSFLIKIEEEFNEIYITTKELNK